MQVADNGGSTAATSQVVPVAAAPLLAPPGSLLSSLAAAQGKRESHDHGRPLRAVRARISGRAIITARGARLPLRIHAERGSTVQVRCRGRGCPARAQSIRARSRVVRFERFSRELPAGAVLEVFVTKRRAVGRYVRYEVRRGKPPLRIAKCVSPGTRRPTKC